MSKSSQGPALLEPSLWWRLMENIHLCVTLGSDNGYEEKGSQLGDESDRFPGEHWVGLCSRVTHHFIPCRF